MGIELESFLDTYLAYGNEKVWNYLKVYPQTMISQNGDITGYKYNDFNLDNVRTGRFILRMYEITQTEKYYKALNTLFRQLESQPRTQNGVWWHKAIYAWQVWLDGVYMGMPFYTMAAPLLRSGEEVNYYDDALNQVTTTDTCTYDAETGLWKHAWDETHSMFWADPVTGQSRHTWARALGWYVMAITEILDVLPEDYSRRGELVTLLQKTMSAIRDFQDKESNVWYDVLDVDDPRNYLEATASSMFTYCMLKGVRTGNLDRSFLEAGIRAYRGLVEEFILHNADGTISLTKCCSVSGLGPDNNRRRDGSFEYYISEPIRDNDAKGIGPFVWASLEMEQLGFTVSNLDSHTVSITLPQTKKCPQQQYDLSGRHATKDTRGIIVSKGRKTLPSKH